ncbi:hypothetical protein BGZ47_005676 [Haplosporangium gracile]|nr:hypothetical protein BGZ47_005676 [Haplosporangium gracile]
MIGIKSALGLMCLLVGSATSICTAPVVSSEASTTTTDIIAVDHNAILTKRSFNLRQKWLSDELNCIQILNPAPGAAYRSGYFVRLNYGAEQCNATAIGPWTIHLYNNLDIQDGKVSYDYHEVIASEVNEYKMQYLWTIPSNQNSKIKNVKKTNEYYIRIETNSQEGVRLVGNAGPFAISSQYDSNGGLDSATPGTTTGGSDVAKIPAITKIPKPHNKAPTDEIHPPVTEIAHTRPIPRKVLVAGAIAGGAIGAGIVGASLFGQVGGVIGAVIGGIIGSIAVLLNFVGGPV